MYTYVCVCVYVCMQKCLQIVFHVKHFVTFAVVNLR
jgi:hypothetical protein